MICTACKKEKGKRCFRVGLIGMSDEEKSIECFDCYRENLPNIEKMAEESAAYLLQGMPWMKKSFERNKELRLHQQREAEEHMRRIESEELE